MHEKKSFFSHVGNNFSSHFPCRQTCQNAVNHLFEKANIYFFRVDQVLHFCTKNNGIIRNAIDENVLFYRVVRLIPH